jgi:hypothetical protein
VCLLLILIILPFIKSNKPISLWISVSDNLAAMFIDTFDKKTPFERLEMDELSFEVDIPEEVIEEIGINEVHQILEKTPSLELVN